MMKGYALLKDGWVTEFIVGSINPKDYPDRKIIEMEASRAIESMPIQQILYWDGEFYQIKDPKKIWKRLRSIGLNGQACIAAFRELQGIEIYPSISNDVVIETPAYVTKTYKPSFVTEIKPGLSLELSKESDVDLWVNAMVASGLYSEDDAWLDASTWLSDPLAWGIKTVWKDRVLQLEMYHFQEAKNAVYAGFQTHLEKRFPMWFWVQLARPVYEAFKTHGIEYAYGYIRKDRRDWVENIKKAYDTEEVEENEKFIHTRNMIKNLLDHIGEWPERRTVPNWKFEKNGYLVREATDSDLPKLLSALEKSWGDSPRKELALRALNEDWNLCNSTFLITIYNDEIVACVDVREKNETVSALHYLMKPTYKPPLTTISFEGMVRWNKETGYQEMSATIETKLYERIKDVWAKDGWKLYSQRQGLTSVRQNIDERLSAYL